MPGSTPPGRPGCPLWVYMSLPRDAMPVLKVPTGSCLTLSGFCTICRFLWVSGEYRINLPALMALKKSALASGLTLAVISSWILASSGFTSFPQRWVSNLAWFFAANACCSMYAFCSAAVGARTSGMGPARLFWLACWR